ncbi:hypothetical protein GGI00_006210 [Coemansia sp. RSA 2681]|nr:hypothetical protein GGI00_006210 [Coemansia sp. RSA 2681]
MIFLFLTDKPPSPHKNRKAYARKTRRVAKKANELLEESGEDLYVSKFHEQVRLPYYNPSKKLGNMAKVPPCIEDVLDNNY